MSKLFDHFNKNTLKNYIIVIVCIIFVSIIFVVGSTYAYDSYTIVFNRAENTEVMRTCKTDASGKLDEDCISTISNVCSKWSIQPWKGSGHTQSNPIASSEFANMTFSQDANYYCYAGSSGNYDMGCYVCNSDSNIMKWHANGNSDNECSAGYTKSSTILTEDKCVTIIPDSCYVCSSDNNIMKWDNNGDSDNKCSAGYISINKPKNECVTKHNTDDNPKTGNILIFIVYIIGLSTICYSLYYYKNLKEN